MQCPHASYQSRRKMSIAMLGSAHFASNHRWTAIWPGAKWQCQVKGCGASRGSKGGTTAVAGLRPSKRCGLAAQLGHLRERRSGRTARPKCRNALWSAFPAWRFERRVRKHLSVCIHGIHAVQFTKGKSAVSVRDQWSFEIAITQGADCKRQYECRSGRGDAGQRRQGARLPRRLK